MTPTCRVCQRNVGTPGPFCPFCGALVASAEGGDGQLVGSTLAGRYFVGQLLGRGGGGRVYKSTDLAQDRLVAIKVLDRPLGQDPAEDARLQREVGAAGRLEHPNCAAILDLGQTADRRLYVVMELLPGSTLARLLDEEFPLGQARAIRICARVLAGLGAAHAQGVLHRGLTPASVMVETRLDEPDLVKVLDFGLTRPVDADDCRSDLHAAGVLLFEMLTGTLPFEAAVGAGRSADTASSPALRRPDLGIAPDLDAAVVKALSTNPADRWQTAEAMREALLICELPPEPVRPREARRARRPDRYEAVVDAPGGRPAGAAPAQKPAAGLHGVPGLRQIERTGAHRPSAAAPPPPAAPAPPTGTVVLPPAAPPAAPPPPAAPGAPVPPTGTVVLPTAAPPGAPPPPAAPAAPAPPTGTVVLSSVPPPAARATPVAPARGSGTAEIPVPTGRAAPAPPSEPAPTPLETARPPRAGLPRESRPVPATARPVERSRRPAPSPGKRRPGSMTTAIGAGVAVAAVVAAIWLLGSDPYAPPPPATPPDAGLSLARPAPPPAPPPGPRKGAGVLQSVQGANRLELPPAAIGQGLLTVTAVPWGVVWIDGKEYGRTPRELRVGEGSYQVRVTHPTLGVQEEVVVVAAGARVPFVARFAR